MVTYAEHLIILLRINEVLELIYLYFPPAVENKGKSILTEIFPSVQKHDI